MVCYTHKEAIGHLRNFIKWIMDTWSVIIGIPEKNVTHRDYLANSSTSMSFREKDNILN